jgi:hypothetical protein
MQMLLVLWLSSRTLLNGKHWHSYGCIICVSCSSISNSTTGFSSGSSSTSDGAAVACMFAQHDGRSSACSSSAPLLRELYRHQCMRASVM